MPLIYVLLSDRTKETYFKMFRIIKSQIPEWEPTLFITDFEEAVIQAFKVIPKCRTPRLLLPLYKYIMEKSQEFQVDT